VPRLRIGNVDVPGRALLAPLSGITDEPFRALAEEFGAALVVSEMIASAALSTGHREMVRKLRKVDGRLPHVVQLAGCESEWLTRGAEIAADAGADIIDINFGCPAKRVTSGYAGSALMRVPDQALRLVEATVAATDRPVTVKMRLGWDDDSMNAAEIAKSAVDAGVQMITVHGRTRQQFYKGEARWAPVRTVVDAVDVPVIVNGDIVDLASARRALEISGAAGVMIGRGAQGQPWIVGQVNAALAGARAPHTPRGADLAELVARHYGEMLAAYGVDLGVRVARKHLDWYMGSNDIALSLAERKELLTSADAAHVRARIPELFNARERVAA